MKITCNKVGGLNKSSYLYYIRKEIIKTTNNKQQTTKIMNIENLIQLFAEAKHQTTLYSGDLSGKTYWEGAQAAYLKILNASHPGWGSTTRGKEVWMCGASDKAVLINKAVGDEIDEYADDPNLEVQLNQDEEWVPEIDSAGFDIAGNDHGHPNKYYNQ